MPSSTRLLELFPDLEFNFQLFDEEAEESVFEVDADAEVLSRASDRAPLPDDLRVPLEASSPALPTRALPLASVSQGPTSSA